MWSVPSPLCQKSLLQEKAVCNSTGPVGGTPPGTECSTGDIHKNQSLYFDNGGKKSQAAFDAMIADYAAPAMDGLAPIEAADAATVLMHGVRITISRDGTGVMPDAADRQHHHRAYRRSGDGVRHRDRLHADATRCPQG